MRYILSLLTACTTAAYAQEIPCGPDAACEIAGGDYHLITPADWDGTSALPALVWYHGHNSSAASVFRSAGLKRDFVGQGYALIAPNGEARPGSNTRAWPARTSSTGRDDVAFTLAVVEDAATKLPINRDALFVAGFSAGGSMAWMMACYAGEQFAGAASVAGALREPHPTGPCPGGPVRFVQVHGFADAQVPFEGRAIRDWHQGDLFGSLALLRQTNGCRTNPDDISIEDTFRSRMWEDSCSGAAIKLSVHDGGHGLPRGWTELARDWLEGK